MPTKPNSVSQKVLGHLKANPDTEMSYDELSETLEVPRDQVPIAVNGLVNNNIHVRKIGDDAPGVKKEVEYRLNPYNVVITQAWVH